MKMFEVKSKVLGKARPRATRIGSNIRMYTPKKTQGYEQLIKGCYIAKYGIHPTDKPVSVTIDITLAIPKATPKKQREKMLCGKYKATKKPDIDNVAKAVLDALNGIAYIDDKQVAQLILSKRYGETEGIRVYIDEE